MVLYSAVSSPSDRSKRFTLHPLADLFTPTPTWRQFPGRIQHCCNYHISPQSIARYSFIQPSWLSKGGFEPRASRTSAASYRLATAPYCYTRYDSRLTTTSARSSFTDLLLRCWSKIFGVDRLKIGLIADRMYMRRSWINSRSLRTHSCLLSSEPAYKEYNNGSTPAISAPTPACCPVTPPTRNTTMDQLPQSPHPLLLVVQWPRLQGIQQWINSRSLRTHSCLLSSDPAYKEYNNGSTPAVSAPTPACCPVTLPTRNTTMDQLPQSPHPLLLVVQRPRLQGIQQWINSRSLRTHSCLLSSDPAYKEYNNGSTPAISAPTPACCPVTPPTRNTTMDQLPQSPHQTWGESTFKDSESESDSGRLFDSESESDSSQLGYDSESNSDSSNISISDSESDSNFQLLIWNYC